MSNKTYSDKQEKMVAAYLGWKQVTGSGSRPTITGDVSGEEWLGECKTHTTSGHRILFDIKVWDKIVGEASAKFKQAAYFVDDGSQKSDRTWVMFMNKALSSNFNVVDYPYPINITTTFNHGEMAARTAENQVYRLQFGPYDVMICSLDTFYNIL